MKKSNKSKKKENDSEILTLDDFIEAQLVEYIELHKIHEKEISYIG